MGRLFIIEGGDGSGKATQTALLVKRLSAEGYKVRSVSFPNYDSEAAGPIKMYLHGDFGGAEDVNAYVASTFYAVDRYASYKEDWASFHQEEDSIIVADRYTTSNMVHQMVKEPAGPCQQAFLDWLEDLEYVKFGLPRPTAVCLLDVPLSVAESAMAERQGKTGGMTGDVHERNHDYLEAVHGSYDALVARYGWNRIACTVEGSDGKEQYRRPEEIHEELFAYIRQYL